MEFIVAVFNHPEFDQHEQVVFCSDQESGLKAIIAVHSTRLGPAVGGCRMWDYVSDEDALVDVLRLSRGMTYKNAMAGLPLGGGKSVIIGNAKTIKSEALFRAFGRMVHRLNGSYYSAEDVNITTHDIMQVNQETPFVAGLEGKSGNPAPFTALGTYQGIKAAAMHQFGSADLNGKVVAVQGLGSVGFYLCEYLHAEGAKLIVTDINEDAITRAVNQFGATAVGLNDIYAVDADIYAPCALGATLNDDTLPQLKVKIIAGCANNQLKRAEHGQKLRQMGILYAPDYVINAGGIINVAFEMRPQGYSSSESTAKVKQIYDTLLTIFERADAENLPTSTVADLMAQEIIARGKLL
ncbi:amino acid dehydrogenase [Alishewanella sp. 16-MA]|uniref:Amino acid dehydrogenase n=1 Tax=Alishewanella maricola TaxID=2795740 RepID=A0ABS8C3I0_9ALTE|nr:Glu/Leu/Phe/Val dehydrogenase [Alishewanella maricola]MCB5226837.1 amino acid dehydrogenase [Alishewanella maricola]